MTPPAPARLRQTGVPQSRVASSTAPARSHGDDASLPPPRPNTRRTLLVLGSGPRAQQLAATLEERGYRVHGFLDDDAPPEAREQLGERLRGGLADLVSVAQEAAIDHVIFGLPRSFLGSPDVQAAVQSCHRLGLDLSFPLGLFDIGGGHVQVDRLGSLPVFRLSRKRVARWGLATKRALDIAGALAGLALSSPLWIAAAIAIKLESPGPVFFVQTRCGRFGKPFPCLKLRTMVQDAERALPHLLEQNEQTGPVFKMRRDPRITRVGRFLRSFSIDELPQLVNVLLGQMSLVGPRPPLPKEVEAYTPDERRRLSMRPGLTCIWQVSGRNEIGFEDWVRLDLQYIDAWSLLLDLKLLLLTVPTVLTRRGAS